MQLEEGFFAVDGIAALEVVESLGDHLVEFGLSASTHFYDAILLQPCLRQEHRGHFGHGAVVQVHLCVELAHLFGGEFSG